MVVDDDPLGVEDVLRGSDWLASPWGLALTELDWDEWREPKHENKLVNLQMTVHCKKSNHYLHTILNYT